MHAWKVIGGDGCSSPITYGWKPIREMPVQEPTENEVRTEKGRIVEYRSDPYTGEMVGYDLGPDNENASGKGKAKSLPPSRYGWSSGASYRC